MGQYRLGDDHEVVPSRRRRSFEELLGNLLYIEN